MAKLVWAGVEREVKCSDAELAEVVAMDDVVMLGCWLGMVDEIGHEVAMMIAKEYCEELAGEA